LSREQYFTMVLLANACPNAYISCSPILKLPPLYHTTCLLLLIKNVTSCTSRETNLSKTALKTTVKAPSRTPQEPEDPVHTTPPASRKQLKRLMLHPNS
jgi:hypothetical protein